MLADDEVLLDDLAEEDERALQVARRAGGAARYRPERCLRAR